MKALLPLAGNAELDPGMGAWKRCIKKKHIQYENKISRFIAQILISLTALKTHLCPTPTSASFSPSLNRAVVFWGSPLVCFLLFGFSPITESIPRSLSLSLHPSLFPSASFFPPGAYWCSLITGACRQLLPAALLCEGCAQIRCARVCVCDWVCIWFFVAQLAEKIWKIIHYFQRFPKYSHLSRCFWRFVLTWKEDSLSRAKTNVTT